MFTKGWSRTQPGPLHGLWFIFPILATVFWTATVSPPFALHHAPSFTQPLTPFPLQLLGLLLWWVIDDNAEQYKLDETTVVFISDVGAAHRALFIPGTALTWLFYALSLFSERWLRHLRRIPGPLRSVDRPRSMSG